MKKIVFLGIVVPFFLFVGCGSSSSDSSSYSCNLDINGTEYSCPDSASCNDCSNNSCGSCSSNGGNGTPATQTLTASCSSGSVRCSSITAGNTISVTVGSLGINSCSDCSCDSGTLSCNITSSNAAVTTYIENAVRYKKTEHGDSDFIFEKLLSVQCVSTNDNINCTRILSDATFDN